MMNDDMGFAWALFGMVGVLCCEVLSSLALARALCGGAELVPSAA
jgi:hypothetical protein